MGKEAQKLIVKLYSVPYRHLQNISFKIRSGTHAIENCGYDKLFDSDKWLEETLDKESNDLAYLMCQIDDDKLDLTAINSVVSKFNFISIFCILLWLVRGSRLVITQI